MPVVVAAGAEAWLNPAITDRETLKRYLRALAPGALTTCEIDSAYGSSTQDQGSQTLPIQPPLN